MTKQAKLVRYEAAVLLGLNYGKLKNVKDADKIYDLVIDTLVQNLNDPDTRLYYGPSNKAKGGGYDPATPEDPKALSGGDGRWLPAMALSRIGPRATNRPDVIKALKSAAEDSKDPKVKEWVEKALRAINAEPR